MMNFNMITTCPVCYKECLPGIKGRIIENGFYCPGPKVSSIWDSNFHNFYSYPEAREYTIHLSRYAFSFDSDLNLMTLSTFDPKIKNHADDCLSFQKTIKMDQSTALILFSDINLLKKYLLLL